jgi:beta-phosphoglucomutase-like phosphatase (HAD superfamily)
MRVDAVIFDCDGVLVDSEPITMGVLAVMVSEAGLLMSTDEAHELFVGRSLRDDMQIIETRLGRPLPPDWRTEYLARRDAALREQVVAVRGIVEALDGLRARGVPVAVASGGDRHKMRLTLGASGLLHRFELPVPTPMRQSAVTSPVGSLLFGADMVEQAKPAPDVYLMAARALGVDPAACLVVEDTPVGVTAGMAAGATVFGYCERTDPRHLLSVGASAVFDDMRRLPFLLST